MERIFVDTGAWVALANSGDEDHEDVRAATSGWEGRLVTTNLVVGETVTLALYRFGHAAAKKLGERLYSGGIAAVVRIELQDERSAWELFCDRDDKEYSFVDCSSFVVMRRLKLDKAVATDDDFAQEGFNVIPVRAKSKR